jgi:hypothetical protein
VPIRRERAALRAAWKTRAALNHWEHRHQALQTRYDTILKESPEDYVAIARAGARLQAHERLRPDAATGPPLDTLRARQDAHVQQLKALCEEALGQGDYARLQELGEVYADAKKSLVE